MTAWDALMASGVIRPDEPVGPLTTYKLGGPARFLAEPEHDEHLDTVLAGACDQDLPVLTLGRGSNLVVADGGFPGVVVRLVGAFRDLAIDDDGVATSGGAVALPTLARTAAQAGWGGVEFYVGIPGAVGGAVTMNAGFLGGQTADVLIDARLVDADTGEWSTRTNAQCAFSYRHSSISATDIVVGARFQLTPVNPAAANDRMREVTRWRKEHQPGGTHNAGSVFKNPDGDAAGRIIDDLGLKGFACGDVCVSDRHANFFVAGAGARAQDVFDLVHAVRRRVRDETGVELEPEIRFAGTFERSA